ncbi:MAG: carbohydrate kinase [Vallitalea sp.]|jgi:fructokinase|nr:carbohydrate kinase [Vallitalea sp.]
MYDVVAIGEALIDFTPLGKSDRGNQIFERNPGGAPANVLAYLAKLNKKTAFIGKVGNDQFGYFLKDTLCNNKIDTKGLKFDEQINTTLAFVHLKEDGDREFSFYRNPGADLNLKNDDIDYEIVKNTKILHFGSLSLTDNPARATTFKVLDYAKQHNILISYDPNLRQPLWADLDLAKKMIIEGLRYADIVKISEEELDFITGIDDVEKGSDNILKLYNNIKLLFVTLGDKGSYYKTNNTDGFVGGFKVEAVDTTGAGDSFLGGILYNILTLDKKVGQLTNNDLHDIVKFSNAGASIVTTRYGAISVMPTYEEIENKLRYS